MDIRVGCSGWYYRHWHGCFYPQELSSHKWFAHYRRSFNTVELNAPFYRWPQPSTVKRWLRDAHRNFVYSVKVNGEITHDRRFQGTRKLIREFCSLGEVLGKHMGAFLFQMPPSFRYTPARLRRILNQLDPRWTNVLEFRHRGWWNDEAFAIIREASDASEGGVLFCCTSGPRLPDTLVKTGLDVYIRFHGVKRWYRHDYSREELEGWAERITTCGARRVYCYFNNDRDAYAIKNARLLRRLLKEA
ncbi:MAG TPA: DUF72 domain-containing protein [Phycisphaerales bacterium]|nr:DUF72 domain-containing protein [Phycisphaerales bacterium]